MKFLAMMLVAAALFIGPAAMGMSTARAGEDTTKDVQSPDTAETVQHGAAEGSSDTDSSDDPRAQARREYFMGMAMVNHQNYEGAVEHLETALKLEPDNYKTYLLLGKVYTRVNRHDDSIKMFQKATEIEPSNAEAYDLLMELYIYLQQPENSLEAAERAMSNGVARAALPDLGWTYFQLGRNDEAEACYKEYLELGGEYFGGYRNLGLVSFARGDYEKALEYFDKAEKLDPENKTLPYLKAHTYKKLGMESEVWREVDLFKVRDRHYMQNLGRYDRLYFPHCNPGSLKRFIFLLKKGAPGTEPEEEPANNEEEPVNNNDESTGRVWEPTE